MSTKTNRDEIWAAILESITQSNNLRFTTRMLQEETESDIHPDTIRSVLNVAADEGFLNHKSSSDAWYRHPDYM